MLRVVYFGLDQAKSTNNPNYVKQVKTSNKIVKKLTQYLTYNPKNIPQIFRGRAKKTFHPN